MGDSKIVLVLLGPSGIGKTTLAKSIARSRDDVMILSTGEKLWEKGKLEPWKECDVNFIKQICHEMIRETFEEFGTSSTHRILVLDCVKDLGDAEFVTSQAEQQGLHIYRTLYSSFDNAETLTRTWNCRGTPRLSSQRKPDVYLRTWRKNFTIVLNYYKRMNVLSVFKKEWDIEPFVVAEDPVEVGNKLWPLTAPPNFAHFLLIDSAQCRSIYENLLSILGVESFEFSIPTSFVHCASDVTWVSYPGRYHVAPKVNGARFLLLKFEDNSFMIGGNHEIFPCDIDVHGLPNNTILDGALLPSKSLTDIHPGNETSLGTSVFLVSDVLAVADQLKWTLPFSMRRIALSELNIEIDMAVVIDNAKASDSIFNPVSYLNIPKGRINPRKLTVNVALLENHPSSPAEIDSCLISCHKLRNLFSGMIFTPETPYNFGSDSLGFTWQPVCFIHSCISAKALEFGQRPCSFPPSLFSTNEDNMYPESIIECRWNDEENSWEPLLQRDDKTTPDSEEMIDHLQKICQEPYDEWKLQSDLKSHTETKPTFESFYSGVIHPALTYHFDELYPLVNEQVSLNRVTKCTEESTNLEVFNCPSLLSSEDPVSQLCQGLVLHPETKTVVTMPFVSFFADEKKINPVDFVEATMKFGGSVGVAFQWDNDVKVATKEGMNSRQATAAKLWIKGHCNFTSFRKGYTYVFEILLKDSMVIVEYPFKGLVLVSITNAKGYELPYNEMCDHSREIGFLMVTPRMTGRHSDVLWYCGGKSPALESCTQSCAPSSSSGVSESVESSSLSGALPSSTRSQEGWVVRYQNGTRIEIIHSCWNKVSEVAKMVHPQIVWLLVKYDKIDEVFKDLPNHLQKEVDRMMSALATQFLKVLMNISDLLDIINKFVNHFRSLYEDLHSTLTPIEKEYPSSNPQRRRRLSDSQSSENRLQESEEDIDNIIDGLTSQFFHGLNVINLTSDRQALEEFHYDSLQSNSPLSQPGNDDYNSTSNGPFECAYAIRQDLRESLENRFVLDMEQLLEICKDNMSYVGENKEFLKYLVEKTLGQNSLTKLPSHLRRKICSMTFTAYERIFQSIVTPRQQRANSQREGSSLSSLLRLAPDVKVICDALSSSQVFTETQRRILSCLNISPFYTNNEQCNDLRIPLLDLIRPDYPQIDLYEPEDIFQETYGKHWNTSQIKEEESVTLSSILTPIYGSSCIASRIPDEILLSIFKFLRARDLVMLSRVCKKFCGIVMSEEVFQREISQARLEHGRKAEEENILTLGSSGEFYSQDSYS